MIYCLLIRNLYISEPLRVIFEFAPYGNLQDFLRSSRGEHGEQYYPDKEPERTLTSYQLLQFCMEVAAGMEYIHDKKVWHHNVF